MHGVGGGDDHRAPWGEALRGAAVRFAGRGIERANQLIRDNDAAAAVDQRAAYVTIYQQRLQK